VVPTCVVTRLNEQRHPIAHFVPRDESRNDSGTIRRRSGSRAYVRRRRLAARPALRELTS
jgi:hypothetical protein